MKSDYTKLIIIGAPRSGTNMLRDALCAFPGVASWKCDEINPIWKHGFVEYPYDDLPAGWVNESNRRFVRERFDRIHQAGGSKVVVEKTCAASLRVAYTAGLLPEAKFLFLVRDGADAVASAERRWASSFHLGYTLRKVRYVPPGDLPRYGARFIRNRWGQWRDPARRMASWGPMNKEIHELASAGMVLEASALQWKECVRVSEEGFSAMEENRFIRMSYEELVRDPLASIRRTFGFLGMEADPDRLKESVQGIRADLIGVGRRQFSEGDSIPRIAPILDETLRSKGYEPLSPIGEREAG